MKNTSESSPDDWNSFRIERVNKSHYPVLALLLNTTNHSDFSAEVLQKKYNTEFLGGDNIGYAAFDGNLAVSHQMGLLTPLCYRGKNYLAIQSCDSVTHPDYGKKGLWVALNEKMFHQIPIDNISGVFGLPNQNSYPIAVKKLGYIAGGIVKNYSINIHKFNIYKIAARLGLGSWMLQKAKKSLKRYQIPPTSFSSFNENNYLIVNRSLAYLNYKIKRGNFFIQLDKTIFWIKIRSGNLFIGDLKTPSARDFIEAINKLKSICYWLGFENIIFQSQEGSFEEKLFAQNYPAMETMQVLYKTYNSTVPFNLLRCTYADLDTF